MTTFLIAAAALMAAQAPAQPAAPPQADVTSGAGTVAASPPAAEVAAIVAREFPAYDKDANGALSQSEFGEWMVKLKAIADPAVTPDAPSTKTWVNAAFAQADTDKSRAVTLGELTGFLLPG